MTPRAASAAVSPMVADPAEFGFELHRDPATLKAEWREFEREAAGHVFATPAFLLPWVEHVAPERGIAPRIVAARDRDGRLAAILPFGVESVFGMRVVAFLGGEHADYPGALTTRRLLADLARDPGRARSFLAAAIAAAGGADVIRFDRQPADIDGLANPFLAPRAERWPDDAHHTLLGTDWSAYYTTKRQPSSRRTDKRKLKKLEAIGPVRFVVASGPDESRPIMEALYVRKREGLALRGVGDIFASAGVRRFYQAVADDPYPGGPAHVTALYCGDEIVAANWGLIRGRRYYYVMHAYAAGGDIGRTSPGRHLMYRMMEWCIERGIDQFDFTIGDEDYKDKWCEVTEPLSAVIAARSSRGLPLAAVLRAENTLKRWVKTTPALWTAAAFTRRRLSALAGRQSGRPGGREEDGE